MPCLDGRHCKKANQSVKRLQAKEREDSDLPTVCSRRSEKSDIGLRVERKLTLLQSRHR
jgi:hypothetical protein